MRATIIGGNVPPGSEIDILGIRNDGYFLGRTIVGRKRLEFPVAMNEIKTLIEEGDEPLKQLKQRALEAAASVFHPTPEIQRRLAFLNA